MREPGVGAAFLEEAADPVHGVLAGLAQAEGGGVAEAGDQLVQVAPERVHEAAVAAARPAPADVLLDEHDVGAGIELLQEPRRPHPRVPAAEDHDVRLRVGRRARGRARPRTPAGRARRGATSYGRRRAGSAELEEVTAVRGVYGSGRALRLLPWRPHPDRREVRSDAGRRARPPAQLGGHGRTPAGSRARDAARGRALARTTSGSRRWVWRPRGTRSRPATTTSTSSPRSRRRACARAAPCRSSSRRSPCPTASRWGTRA